MSEPRIPRILPFAILTFLIGVGFFITFAIVLREPGPQPAPVRRDPGPAEPGRTAPPPGEPARETAADETEKEETPEAVRTAPGFSGVVLDPTGAPAAGAEVIVFVGSHPSIVRWRTPEVLARTAADDAGRFRLALSRRTDGAVLRASRDGLMATLRNLDGGHVGRIEVGTLRLEGGIRLTGRVVDPDGQPLAEAEVVAGDHPNRMDRGGRTDEEGRFDFVTPVKEGLNLAAGKTGFCWKAWPVPEPAVGERDLGDLTLPPARTLHVRVVPGGTPWPGSLEVAAYPPRMNGLLVRRPVPETNLVDIPISWPGPANVHLMGPGELDLASKKNVMPGRGVVELEVPETDLIEGIALDAVTGEPVEVLEAGLVWGGLYNEMSLEGGLTVAARTRFFPQDGSKGTWRLPKLDFRRAPLILKTATHGIHFERMPDLESQPVRVEIPAPGRVEVLVSGLEGGGDAVLRQGAGIVDVVPVKEGRAMFVGVVPERYAVEVVPASPEYARTRTWSPVQVGPEGATVELTVTRAGAIRGRVVDETGAALPWTPLDATMWIASRRRPSRRILCDADGSFAVGGLLPGKWSLVGKDVPAVIVEVAAGEEAEVLLRRVIEEPIEPGFVEGRVRPKGVLAPLLRVWIAGYSSPKALSLDGSFKMRVAVGRQPRTVEVVVGTSRERPLAKREVEVGPGRTVTVDLEVTVATLKGRIVDASGTSIASAYLLGRLAPAEGALEQQLWLRSGGDGRFTILALGRGTVELSVYRAERIGKGATFDDVGEPDATISREVAEGIVDLGDVTLK